MRRNKTLFSNEELASFCKQMTLILHAGISAYEGITLMYEDWENENGRKKLEIITIKLEEGKSLYDSFVASEAFPTYLLDLIHIGEIAGRLEEVMKALSIHYERLHQNNEDIKSAITYPFIMIIMMLLVVYVLITQVLPIFSRVFQQLGSSINGFSKGVLDFGLGLSSYSYLLLLFLLLVVGMVVYFTQNEKGKAKFYRFMTKFSLTRNITLKLALSQFTSGMSIAMSSGLDIEQSLAMAKRLLHHDALLKRIDKAQTMIDEKDIATCLVDAQVLTGMYAQLIKIGYKTGGMDMILQEIAEKYNEETNERIHHLISIIEPTLVAVLSILVGLVLLSIMMPLIGIMSSL